MHASYATSFSIVPQHRETRAGRQTLQVFSSIDIAAFKILVFVMQVQVDIISCERILELRHNETTNCDSGNMLCVWEGAWTHDGNATQLDKLSLASRLTRSSEHMMISTKTHRHTFLEAYALGLKCMKENNAHETGETSQKETLDVQLARFVLQSADFHCCCWLIPPSRAEFPTMMLNAPEHHGFKLAKLGSSKCKVIIMALSSCAIHSQTVAKHR